MSTLGIAMLIIVVVGVGLWWFEIRGAASPGSQQPEGLGVVALPVGLNPTGRPAVADLGRAAPNFTLSGPAGEVLTLTDFRGRYVLVNFWASWCGPCRGETPALEALYQRSGRSLVVLGVNQQESAETARSFLEEFAVTYPVVLDLDGEVNAAYRVARGLPISMLIDPAGIVLRVYVGRVTDEQLAALEAEYLQ
ncbi:MAG: redoxin domain-containing protein [Dehalococcoidia bacterium]